ncbi:nicotinamide riboside transporter PnuC [Colwellia sp. MEBiC06753]
MFAEFIQYFENLSTMELVAVLSALAYVVFAARESIWCWPAALLSTTLYTIIFYDVYLWMDSLLQLYYFVMAIYGWYCWNQRNDALDGKDINKLPLKNHLKPLVWLAVISCGVGYLMANYTPTTFPYVDAATTVYAIYATYLVTQKVLENWLYWIVIDFVSIYVYLEKGLTPTAMLFVIYVVIAFIGYLNWQAKFKHNLALTQASLP